MREEYDSSSRVPEAMEDRELDPALATRPGCRRRALLPEVWYGLLAALVLWMLAKSNSREFGRTVCNWSHAKASVAVLADAVARFADDHDGRFPGTLEELLLPAQGLPMPYLDVDFMPPDPWGTPYGYEPPEAGSCSFRVFSLGADSLPGGKGDDRDIDNLLIKEGKI